MMGKFKADMVQRTKTMKFVQTGFMLASENLSQIGACMFSVDESYVKNSMCHRAWGHDSSAWESESVSPGEHMPPSFVLSAVVLFQ